MLTKDFYKSVDAELSSIIERYETTNAYLKKHKQHPYNQKSYAFMIWFLEFYTQVNGYISYITDGDGDGSCDMMFPYHNDSGQQTYCIVQAKWKAESNCEKLLEDKEALKALSRFETILNGEKQDVNPEVKKRIEALQNHTRQNLPVKFIFLTLCKKSLSVSDEFRDFKNRHKKTYIEWIDIEQLKRDFIDKKFKKIKPNNPFEIEVDLEEEPITLKIARLGKNKRDVIHLEKPFESYVFLVKPKTVFELFERYGFRLFFKNIRNPLIQSKINQLIERTATDNAPYFWYYNNGITAITNSVDELGSNAEQLAIEGLQVINGAQTFFSIYNAYLNASTRHRKRMDEDTFITFRLIRSAGQDFNLNVTRFTNSQNPISGRDFHANDAIQEQLQHDFFNTKVWYEKRDGEFRDYPEGITVVPNSIFARSYLAFGLQDPVSLMQENSDELLFLSEKENENGLYEKVFHPFLKWEEFLAAYYMVMTMFEDSKDRFLDSNEKPRRDTFHILALSHTCLKNHFTRKFGEKVAISRKIIELYEKNQLDVLNKALDFSLNFWLENVKGDNADEQLAHFNEMLSSRQVFLSIRDEWETFTIDLDVSIIISK